MPDAGFPERVDDVPASRRITETFGWQPGAWGAALVVAFAVMLSSPPPGGNGATEYAISGTAILGGLTLAAYECRRRKNRTVLAPTQDQVAVYRRGRFDLSLARGQITIYVLQGTNTIKVLLAPVMMAAAFWILLLLAPVNVLERTLLLVASIFSTALVGSLLWTRLGCEHLFVPRRTGRPEMVMIRRAERGRLFA